MGWGFGQRLGPTALRSIIFDPYSLTHVLHGVIFFWLLRPLAARVGLHWRLIGALVLEVGWEVLENSPWVIERYRQQTASLDYTGDSIVNSLGDVVSMIVGFVFASQGFVEGRAGGVCCS